MREIEIPDQQITWPPPYTIRQSNRAKRVSLKISPNAGLEVIMPTSAPYMDIDAFLSLHRRWIDKHLTTIVKSEAVIEPPKTISLASINEVWEIKYLALNKNNITVIEALKLIVISYNRSTNAEQSIKEMLKQWLITKAESYLVETIRKLAEKYDFSINKVKIKGQKTLWGSCDSKRNINLNYKLLFLPKPLSNHVILHELCHTKHLNHGKRFWNLMQKLDAECDANRKKLRHADEFIPSFINV